MPEDKFPDLLDLIGFCLSASWLDIQDFFEVVPSENVMVASDPLFEAQFPQKLT